MELLLPPGIDRFPRHLARLEAVCAAGMRDAHVLGMAIGGSIAAGLADEYADLDLQLAVEDDHVDALGARLPELARDAGRVVADFTAEHVGLPHMLIVLYDDLMHVDLEPVGLSRIGERNAGLTTHVLWERDGAISTRLGAERTDDVAAQLAWFERRMWTWSWYVQSKILRGELYEAIDGIQYIRNNVLFALVARARGVLPSGSRRMEDLLDELGERFERTVPAHDAGAAMTALEETMALYVELADPLMGQHGIEPLEGARAVVRAALQAGRSWDPREDAL